jgi:ATP-dependent DNA helicase RecG
LREALANAFCHRDYSVGGGSVAVAVYDDRLEIASTGTLHFGLTPEMLYRPHESLPWNPLIARVFYRCGVIEAWGRGTIKMEELTSRAGLPSPKIYENAGCVVVQFCPMVSPPPRQETEHVTERQKQIQLILGANSGGMAFRQIQAELAGDIPAWEIKNELSALKKIGLATSHGRGRGARWSLA